MRDVLNVYQHAVLLSLQLVLLQQQADQLRAVLLDLLSEVVEDHLESVDVVTAEQTGAEVVTGDSQKFPERILRTAPLSLHRQLPLGHLPAPC